MMQHESELQVFAEDFREEIAAIAGVDEEESYRENAFTERIIEALIDCGEVDDAQCCFYRSHGLQLNGFGVSSPSDTLYLFASICKWEVPATTLKKAEVESVFNRLVNFFQKSCIGFHDKLEEASDAYDAAFQIHDLKNTIAGVRFILLSDCITDYNPKLDPAINGVASSYEIWDLVRLHRLWTSGREREEIQIDFTELFGESLDCMDVTLPDSPYKSYLSIFTGDLLVKIYETFGPRLLEKNVRTFLQFRGKVNKGIRETILNEPEMFLAFNNGICIVADEAVTKPGSNGRSSIIRMKDFQIVNGAQTVASLYGAHVKDKADLSKIRVVGKITAVSSTSEMDDMVPKISQYSNSQNKISVADFSSNHPFHRRLEELSRTVWAPAVRGEQRQTRWFYERARGQYLNEKARERTPARKRAFEAMHPSRQKFTKTDLAKFENTWFQLPHLVSRGAQKNFQEFMVRLADNGSYLPDEEYFRRLIAKAIMFRRAELLVQRQKYGGYRANIVTYTLSYIVRRSDMRIDLENIWQEQGLSEVLQNEIINVSKYVFEHITSPPGGANITEWCKKQECWDKFCEVEINISPELEKEFVEMRPGGGEKLHLDKNTITEEDMKNIREVMSIPSESWLSLSLWAKQTRNLQPWQRSLAYNIGKRYVGKDRDPSKKQAIQALKIMKEAKRLGFDPANPVKPDFD